jgi:hypothetical protein
VSQFAVIFNGAGLDLRSLETPQRRRALALAINKITRDSRAKAAATIRKQVNLPASYVAPSQGRLAVVQQANQSRLEGVIRARGRNTSLARYARTASGGVGARGGVYVSVKPGSSRYLKRAFLIRLRQGDAMTDTQSNLGLAMRLKPGETLRGKINFVRMRNGLYLLYGPSVHQMLMSASGDGIAKDMEPEILRTLTDEFLRLMDL